MATSLLDWTDAPPFDSLRIDEIEPAVRALIADAEALLAMIEGGQIDDPLAVHRALDDMSERMARVWGPVGHLLSVRNSDELRSTYAALEGDMVRIGLAFEQSEGVHRAMQGLLAHEACSASPALRRVVDRRLRDAELAGITLQGAERERFNAIAERLSQLGTTFSNHVLDATRAFGLDLHDAAQVAGLPESALTLLAENFRRAHPETQPTPTDGPWRATLDGPSFLAVLEYAANRSLRETVYRAYVRRAADGELDNHPVIDEILALRHEMARLLGRPHWADVSLASKMADLDGVRSLLERLREVALPVGRAELDELRAWAREHEGLDAIEPWDVALLRRRVRESRFGFTQEELRPYFPLHRVLEGLFALIETLFGARIEAADGEAPVWHPDVRYFRVFDVASGEALASFYLDPYARPADKRGGAWMNTCVGRWQRDGVLQLPIAYLVCNGTPPVGERPSLLTFDEVTTLFHEFGHGLQHMLTHVGERDAAGINGVEWDAVELPSQFMENWCYHRETLLGLTGHWQTGEPLPEDLYEKLVQARTFHAASLLLRQLLFGRTDIELHSRDLRGEGTSATAIMQAVAAETSPMPLLPDDAYLCGFGHIFSGGYAAGYYSYKWAEVLSADAFSAFEEAPLSDPDAVRSTGRRFRETVLGRGGSEHPMDVFEAFRGRGPDPDSLLRHHGLLPA